MIIQCLLLWENFLSPAPSRAEHVDSKVHSRDDQSTSSTISLTGDKKFRRPDKAVLEMANALIRVAYKGTGTADKPFTSQCSLQASPLLTIFPSLVLHVGTHPSLTLLCLIRSTFSEESLMP